MANRRNSAIELLRLFSIFGIVCMHTFGEWYSTATGSALIFGVGINSIFNAGVSIFILISGYFGLTRKISKIVRLECEVLFYSIISMLKKLHFNDGLAIKEVIKAFFPVFTNKYWFITVYMILMIFSPYIEKLISCISKKEFMILLLCMLSIFSVFPTFLYFDIMSDSGKGFFNMLLIYLIGRWIRLYGKENYSKLKILLSALIVFGIGFCANVILSIIRGGEKEYLHHLQEIARL